jgi:hypothetical protein
MLRRYTDTGAGSLGKLLTATQTADATALPPPKVAFL